MKRAKHILLLAIVCLLSLCFGLFLVGCDDPSKNNGSGNGNGNGNEGSGSGGDEEYWIVSVEMTTPPDKADYGEGDVFDPTGMVLEVTWNDGWVQEVRDGQNCLFTPNGEITVDTESIKGTYDTYTFTVDVNVNGLDGIEVVSMPARTLYVEGESFSTTGMKVQAVLDNGEKGAEITEYTLSQNAESLSTTDNKVTVTYTRGTKTYTVDVPIKVLSANQVVTIEAESGTVVGGEKVTSSMLLKYASGNSFVRNLNMGATITIDVKALKETTASLRFVASSYEDDPEGGAFAIPLQINEVVSVSFNGTPLEISDDEVLPGGVDDSRGQLSRYCHWYEIALDDVTLNAGSNLFVITSLVNMNLKDDEDTEDVNEADLHSTLFDCLRVFYADAEAIPSVDDELPTTNTGGVYQAEKCELAGVEMSVKSQGYGSTLFPYMESAGDTDPGFIKNFSANGTLRIVFASDVAKKVKISIWGSSTSNVNLNLSTLVSSITLNGTAITPANGVMFPNWGSLTGAQAMANWQEYVVGEFDAKAGNNEFVITFNATEGAFIDRIVISEVNG